MIKYDYIEKIALKNNTSKVLTQKIIEDFIEELKETISNQTKTSVTNFGVFTKTEIKPSVMYSPVDGHTLKSEKYFRITFTCSKVFLEKIKNNS